MVETKYSILAIWLARLLRWLRPHAVDRPSAAAATHAESAILSAPVAPSRFHLAARLCSAAKLNRPKRASHRKMKATARNRPITATRVKRQHAETRHVWLTVRHVASKARPGAVVLPFAPTRRARSAAPPVRRAA